MSASDASRPRLALPEAAHSGVALPGLSALRRGIDTASSYLPVLLMALLALGSWWLVKNTPLLEPGRAPVPPRHEPDYTMARFMVQRFAPEGPLRTQIEGDELRHYPDTDTFEIDNPRIRGIAPDGRVTIASAKRWTMNRAIV